jgi:DNA replication protein DnaC
VSRAKPVPAAGTLSEQAIRQYCRMLKMPTVASQSTQLAQAAVREGHSPVQYLEALLAAEIEERERRAVARRIHEARLPRVKAVLSRRCSRRCCSRRCRSSTSASRRCRRRASPT